MTRQHVGDRRLGGVLQARVERGADGEVAVGGAGEVADLVGDPVGEIALARPGDLHRARGGAGLRGGERLRLVDDAGLDHAVEHLGGARRGRVACRGSG